MEATETFQTGAEQFTVAIDIGGETIVTGHHPDGFTVPEGETWRCQGLVTSSGNVVSYGRLKGRAGATLRLVDVDESAFVGGGNDVLPTDIGVWIMPPFGVIDFQGTPKVAWNRIGFDPSWLPSDVLKITPTAYGDYACRSYAVGDPIPQAYPDVPSAEVLNLTRDCRIEGTPGGKSHIFILSPQVQFLKYVEISHMGPRKGIPPNDDVVVGRWPLHFHHGGEGTRGTVVEGVVLHDLGAYGFVPHDSSGIDFLYGIIYDGRGAGGWWDNDETTVDARWLYSVVANIKMRGPGEKSASGFRMHKFAPGGVLRGCVVAAINDPATFPESSNGLGWPTGVTDDHWVVEDNVLHNLSTGMRWWANQISTGTPPARTDRTTIYNCEYMGIDQGAYANPVRHDEVIMRAAAYTQHSNSKRSIPGGQLAGGTHMDIDVKGRFTHALFLTRANLGTDGPTTYIEGKLDGGTVNAVQIMVNDIRRDFWFVRETVNGVDLEFADFDILDDRAPFASQNWLAKVQRLDGTAYQFGPIGGPTDIPGFA